MEVCTLGQILEKQLGSIQKCLLEKLDACLDSSTVRLRLWLSFTQPIPSDFNLLQFADINFHLNFAFWEAFQLKILFGSLFFRHTSTCLATSHQTKLMST